MTITEWLKDGFEKAFPGVDLPEIKAVPATDPKFGDYQCNDALKIAKKAGFRNPREAAQRVVECLFAGIQGRNRRSWIPQHNHNPGMARQRAFRA